MTCSCFERHTLLVEIRIMNIDRIGIPASSHTFPEPADQSPLLPCIHDQFQHRNSKDVRTGYRIVYQRSGPRNFFHDTLYLIKLKSGYQKYTSKFREAILQITLLGNRSGLIGQ